MTTTTTTATATATAAFAQFLGLAKPSTGAVAPAPPEPRAAAVKPMTRATTTSAIKPAASAPAKTRSTTAVSAERARCAQILAHGIKHGCVEQAGHFAFDTDMTAAQAVSALNLRATTESTMLPSKAVGGPVTSAKAQAGRIVAAWEKINQL